MMTFLDKIRLTVLRIKAPTATKSVHSLTSEASKGEREAVLRYITKESNRKQHKIMQGYAK